MINRTNNPQVIEMLKLKIGILLVVCLTLISIPAALAGTPTTPVVYVSGDGNGDYNCDGVNDQVEINQALRFVEGNTEFTTVHLKGPFTYVIDDTILIGSNTILEGDSDAVIKLINNAGWPQYQGLIEPNGDSVDNIIIQGFEIYGNDANQPVSNGNSYYTLISLDDCTDVTVRNMYMHDSNNDGIQVLNDVYSEGNGNINIYDNVFYRCSHNSIYLMRLSNANIYNNKITPYTNDGITIAHSNHISIHNNIIDPGEATGGCGINILKGSSIPDMDDIEIYDNKISNTNLAGILVHGYNSYPVPSGARDIYIHHNTILGCGQHMGLSAFYGGGIGIEGFENTIIENNVIDGCYHDGITIKDIWSTSPSYTYNTAIRNNIITNTNVGRLDAGSGYGIRIYDTSKYTATLEYNNVWNNAAGNYYGLSAGATDVSIDPLSSTISIQPTASAGSDQTDKKEEDSVIKEVVETAVPEIKEEVVETAVPEIKEKVVETAVTEIKEEVEEAPAPEIKEKVVETAVPEIKEEVEEAPAPEIKEKVVETAVPEIKEEVEEAPAPEIKEKVVETAVPEIKEKVEEAPAPEIKEKVVETAVPEIKEEVEEAPAPEIKEKVVETAVPEIKEEVEEAPAPEIKEKVVETAVPEIKEKVEEAPAPEIKEKVVETAVPEIKVEEGCTCK